jgi:alpha-beta hydrolase superfamily lysophospholipase
MGGRARNDPEFVRRHGDQRLGEPPAIVGYAWQLAALALSPGSLPWLRELNQPTLVVAGDDDPVMPMANALLLAHRIPTSRLVVAPGEGHLLLLDPESSMLPAIARFLRARSHTATDVWRQGRVVTDRMVDEGLRPQVELFNPIAAMSAAVRHLGG